MLGLVLLSRNFTDAHDYEYTFYIIAMSILRDAPSIAEGLQNKNSFLFTDCYSNTFTAGYPEKRIIPLLRRS